MNFFNNKPLDSVVGNTTRTSAAQKLQYAGKLSVVVISDHSSANGAIQLQVSNDPASEVTNTGEPTNWVNLGSSSAVSGAVKVLIPQQDVCYGWYRVVYTDSSGGSATAKITAVAYGFSY